jgi:hypothetical protein
MDGNGRPNFSVYRLETAPIRLAFFGAQQQHTPRLFTDRKGGKSPPHAKIHRRARE